MEFKTNRKIYRFHVRITYGEKYLRYIFKFKSMVKRDCKVISFKENYGIRVANTVARKLDQIDEVYMEIYLL